MKSNATIAIILSFLFINLSAFAEGGKNTESSTAIMQANLSGTIIDNASGETLGGAEIDIVGTDIKIYSDLDGNFTLPNITPGEYSIIVSFISYEKSYVENIDLKAGEKKNLEVKLITAK